MIALVRQYRPNRESDYQTPVEIIFSEGVLGLEKILGYLAHSMGCFSISLACPS